MKMKMSNKNSSRLLSPYIKGWLLLSMCFSLVFIQAQNSSLDSTTVINVEEYKPFLNEAHKIKSNPVIQDTFKIIPQLRYSFLEKNMPVSFNIDTIKHAKVVGEPLTKLYRGYAKVGYGTNGTTVADVFYNSTRNRDYAWGVHAGHLSSSGLKDVGRSAFSDNHFGLYGKKFSRQFTWKLGFDYDRNAVHYYGIPDSLPVQYTPSEGIQQQLLNKYTGVFGLSRNFTDTNQFDYNADVKYYHLKDVFGVSENNIQVDGRFNKYHKRELYELGVKVNYNKLTNDLELKSTTSVGLIPQISTQTSKWKLNLGAGLFVNSQQLLEEENDFHFYPIAEFKYNIVDDIIIPYVGIKGEIINNNFNTFFAENPFVNADVLAVLNSNQKYDIYGGIRGSISDKISFKTSVSKQKIDNQPLYVKEHATVLQNKFNVIYDEITFFNVNAEIAYQKLEKIKVLFTADYFAYEAAKELEVWHKPEFKTMVSGIYDLSDKILVRLDVFVLGKQYAKIYTTTATTEGIITTPEAKELGGLVDINIGFEYRYTKKLSAFINFMNIGSVEYEKYQDYATQRFNILGGLTYSF